MMDDGGDALLEPFNNLLFAAGTVRPEEAWKGCLGCFCLTATITAGRASSTGEQTISLGKSPFCECL